MDSARCAQYLNENLETVMKLKNIGRYLSNVNVGAILVDLRVVFIEDGVVNACGGGDQVTIIVLLDYISGRAVLSLPSKAVTLANDKVVTCIIDDSDVDDSKLVAAGKNCQQRIFNKDWDLTYVETLLAAEILSQISPA